MIERFDRVLAEKGWLRRPMVSALTLFELDEMMARCASYQDLADIVRHRFEAPTRDLRELFGRLVFNVLVGNTDDHARNHAASWDGTLLALTPAYDICPQARAGREASQAMLILDDDRSSRIATCLAAASRFLISAAEAASIVDDQIRRITAAWDDVCGEAGLSEIGRRQLWGRQILNPFVFQGAPEEIVALAPVRP